MKRDRPKDTVVCPAWAEHRRVLLEAIGSGDLSRPALVEAMVWGGGAEAWEAITSFYDAVMLGNQVAARQREIHKLFGLYAKKQVALRPIRTKPKTQDDSTLSELNAPSSVLFKARVSTRASKSTKEGPDTRPTVCQGRGNRSNEIPGSWQLGQVKEHARLLVSSQNSNTAFRSTLSERRYLTKKIIKKSKLTKVNHIVGISWRCGSVTPSD